MGGMRLALAVGLALALTACDGDGGEGGTPTPSLAPSASPSASPSPSPSASPSPSPSPTPALDLQLPKDAPTELEGDVTVIDLARDGFAPMLPPGATATASQTAETPVEQVWVVWFRGDDPFSRRSGLVLWQRTEPDGSWRAVYAFTDRPSKGVLGITLQTGDLTGDGVPDLLSREDTGGTGACATWRVVITTAGAATEVYRHVACDTTLDMAGAELRMREAVYEPEDPHCCPSAFRISTLAWDGRAFAVTSSELVEVEA